MGAVGNIIRRYWSTYGGTSGVYKSAYFHVAVLATALSFRRWMSPNWWDQVLSILPNLLGFSLAGYAMLLGLTQYRLSRYLFSASDLDSLLRGGSTEYLKLNSTFVHFLVVQALALLLALLLGNCYDPVFFVKVINLFDARLSGALWLLNDLGRIVTWGLSYLIFCYAIALTFASTFAVFSVAIMLNTAAADEKALEEENDPAPESEDPEESE